MTAEHTSPVEELMALQSDLGTEGLEVPEPVGVLQIQASVVHPGALSILGVQGSGALLG